VGGARGPRYIIGGAVNDDVHGTGGGYCSSDIFTPRVRYYSLLYTIHQVGEDHTPDT